MKKKIFLEDYVIYEDGKIWSNITNKFLKKSIDKYGYEYIQLKTKKYKVHRLVAISFIENPKNKPQVNHKDGNKLNNNLENLEWSTEKENINHAIKNGLIQKQKKGKDNSLTKKVYIFNKKGELIDILYGHKEAAKKYNIPIGTASDQVQKNTFNINRIETEVIMSYKDKINIRNRDDIKSIKEVYVYNKEGKIIDIVNGANEASRKYSIPKSTVKYQCKSLKRNKKKEIFFSYDKNLM